MRDYFVSLAALCVSAASALIVAVASVVAFMLETIAEPARYRLAMPHGAAAVSKPRSIAPALFQRNRHEAGMSRMAAARSI